MLRPCEIVQIRNMNGPNTKRNVFQTSPRGSGERVQVAAKEQPRSQGLSSSRPIERERERDPGMVWSRASQKIEDAREGSLYFNCCCHLLCHRKDEAFVFNASVVHCLSRCFTAVFILQFRLAATTTSM